MVFRVRFGFTHSLSHSLTHSHTHTQNFTGKVYNDGDAIVDSGTSDTCFSHTAFKAIKSHFESLCKTTCLTGVCTCDTKKPVTQPIFESRFVSRTTTAGVIITSSTRLNSPLPHVNQNLIDSSPDLRHHCAPVPDVANPSISLHLRPGFHVELIGNRVVREREDLKATTIRDQWC